MVEAGGKVIRYVKATLSVFFINLLLKYISSTTYVENNYLNGLKFFFLAIFQRFYWLMASSAQPVLTNKNVALEDLQIDSNFLYGG